MNVVAHQLKCNDPDFRAIVCAHRDDSHRKRIHLRIAKNDRMILRCMQVIKGTKTTKRLLKKAFAPTFLIQKRMSHGDRRQMSGIENIRNHNPTLFLLQRHYGSGCTRKLQPKPPESKKKIKKVSDRHGFPQKRAPTTDSHLPGHESGQKRAPTADKGGRGRKSRGLGPGMRR